MVGAPVFVFLKKTDAVTNTVQKRSKKTMIPCLQRSRPTLSLFFRIFSQTSAQSDFEESLRALAGTINGDRTSQAPAANLVSIRLHQEASRASTFNHAWLDGLKLLSLVSTPIPELAPVYI